MVAVAKWPRHGVVAPASVGSIPTSHPELSTPRFGSDPDARRGFTERRGALSTGARPRSGALGPVAQLGGHLGRNQEIAGSSPARSTRGMASPALVVVGTEVSGGGPLKSAGGLAPSSRGRSSSRRASVWQTEGSGCESPRLHGGYRSRWATRLEPGGAVARRGSIPLPSAVAACPRSRGCRHLVKPLDCRSSEAGSIPVSPAGRYGSRRPERSAKASGFTAARVRVPHLPLEGPSCTGARCSPGTRVATARGLWVRFPPLPPGRGLDGKPLASDARVVRVRLPPTRLFLLSAPEAYQATRPACTRESPVRLRAGAQGQAPCSNSWISKSVCKEPRVLSTRWLCTIKRTRG